MSRSTLKTTTSINAIVFSLSTVALSWFLMMALHEMGHVVGAMTSGGVVERVVLHPLTISRTDVQPNPQPLWVVWLGPIIGCLIPLAMCWAVPKQLETSRKLAMFFAGFCLIANGAYSGIGAFDSVGDCGTMLQHGSPLWTLLVFGCLASCGGLYAWHRLGEPSRLPKFISSVDWKTTFCLTAALAVLVLCATVFSTR